METVGGPQSLKYVLLGSLQKTFAEPCIGNKNEKILKEKLQNGMNNILIF